jgi:phage antirepressor YoqD-like protein
VRPGGHNSPYTRIQELAEELEAISHSNVEQERLKEILRSTAIQIQDEKAHSNNPPGQIHRGRITKVNGDMLSTG